MNQNNASNQEQKLPGAIGEVVETIVDVATDSITTNLDSSVADTVETVAESSGDFVGDVIDSVADGVDEFPLIAVVGIATGIAAAIGGIGYAIYKYFKKSK